MIDPRRDRPLLPVQTRAFQSDAFRARPLLPYLDLAFPSGSHLAIPVLPVQSEHSHYLPRHSMAAVPLQA
jgi:hypothetical protein